MNGKKFYVEIKDYEPKAENIKIILKKGWCEIDGNLHGNILYFSHKQDVENENKIIIGNDIKIFDSIKLINKKLLFIAVDGIRSDAFALSKIYFFKNLMENKKCLYSFYLQSIKQTWSSWSWASILTGKKKSHKVRSNINIPQNLKNTFIDKVIDEPFSGKVIDEPFSGKVIDEPFSGKVIDEPFSSKDFGLYVSNWKGFYKMLYQKAHKHHLFSSKNYNLNDNQVTLKIIKELKNNEIEDINFVYLEQVDCYGHKYGFSPCCKEYKKSIKRVSEYIENIYQTLEERVYNCSDEEWLFIVCSDHGGNSTNFMKEEEIDKVKRIRGWDKLYDKGVHGLSTPSHVNTICFMSIVSENKMEITGEILPEPKSLDINPTILHFFDIDNDGRNLLKK
jgi:predicted AlkP superfamily pyrophosphatase or phosphodiesterase